MTGREAQALLCTRVYREFKISLAELYVQSAKKWDPRSLAHGAERVRSEDAAFLIFHQILSIPFWGDPLGQHTHSLLHSF